MKKFIFLICLIPSLLLANSFNEIGRIPVQDAGRVKPFDTFAKEALQLIYGKQTYKTENGEKKSATEIIFTWMLLPDYWNKVSFIQLKRLDLKDALGLDKDKSYFSPIEIMSSPRIQSLMQNLASKRDAKERLDAYDQSLQTLSNQLQMFQGISQGLIPGIMPKLDSSSWRAYASLRDEERQSFDQISKRFIEIIKSMESKENIDSNSLKTSVDEFIANASSVDSKSYTEQTKNIALELHFNNLSPFMWSWIIYALSAVFIILSWVFGNARTYTIGLVLCVVGFILHTYGFGLRMWLTGRPPVSNMYETVVWVPWGAVLFALIFEWFKKSKYIVFSSAICSVVCLILADMAPGVLDASLQPLEPVLRSNLWLTVHVLTITLSYGAFFLAFVLADIALFYYLKGEKENISSIHELFQSIYRAEKVGVVLLAAGTILGGVWADYSWGRFWGWDPKETWAFIALLGYLALLHAKHGGYVRQLGLIAGSVIAFSLVIMAWYGVNYVLGAGLHSYGFGAGGLEWVGGFVSLHFMYVAFVVFSRKNK